MYTVGDYPVMDSWSGAMYNSIPCQDHQIKSLPGLRLRLQWFLIKLIQRGDYHPNIAIKANSKDLKVFDRLRTT